MRGTYSSFFLVRILEFCSRGRVVAFFRLFFSIGMVLSDVIVFRDVLILSVVS